MEITTIQNQVHLLSASLAQRAALRAAQLPRALGAMKSAADLSLETLTSRIAKAGPRWSGAHPAAEPLSNTFPPPAVEYAGTIIGADGSQIYPDRHAPAYFALVNIASIAITHASGQVPETAVHTTLFSEDRFPYQEGDWPLTPALVDAIRDLMELEELARQCEQNREHSPLALLDNSLLLWFALQANPGMQSVADRLLQNYLGSLTSLKETGATIAGFIDRPRSSGVLSLLQLGTGSDSTHGPDSNTKPDFAQLTDGDLFDAHLPPGHRSARFVNGSPLNQAFRTAGHETQFFYLNTGGTTARVEIPIWVAEQPELLSAVHAGILAECRTTGGYPYALIRAHELAVLGKAEREALDGAITHALIQRGLPVYASLKARAKEWTGPPRRHRI
jgi:hypothetical protein